MEKIKVGIPQKVMGLVIGKQHSNFKKIQSETGARIEIVGRNNVYVSGNHKQCKEAIRQLKTSANEALYSTTVKKQFPFTKYDFVDGSGKACDYRLHEVELQEHHWQDGECFRIERVDEEEEMVNEEIQICDLKGIVDKVLQKIQAKDGTSDEIPKANFWCHFGHLNITGNVDEADRDETYSLENLRSQFNKKGGWKMLLDPAIKNMLVEELESALTSNKHKTIPPHIRYDLTFITPSCGNVRAKFFLDLNGKPLNLEFACQFIDVKEVCLSSASQQEYVLCEGFRHRAKVNIAIPSRAMDVRIMIRTVPRSPDMEENEHEETLKTYLDRITFSDEGEICLPDDKYMPYDFALQFLRKCKRRLYGYTEEEESFTIVISDEEELIGARTAIKTDVHLYSDQCNQLLRSEDWEPEQIVSRLPTFLSALRGVQENISTSEE